jgi:hypothetical protein
MILYTYLHVRRKVASTKKAGPMAQVDVTFRMNRTETDNSGMPTKPAPASNMRSMSYDRWLIARFLVCFGLSNVLQVCVILFYMFSFDQYKAVVEQGGPDYSLRSTLIDLSITIPGVASGLGIFIVFGTTAPFRREYRKLFQPCRRKRQGRDGPIMVAPLDSINNPTNEILSGRRRSLDEEESDLGKQSTRRSYDSSVWEIPPMDFGDFSEKEVLPRQSL